MELPAPGLDLLARFWVELGPPIEVGDAGFGRRRIIPIVGGRFEGPRLSGSIRPLGADWQGVDAEGTARIDTRHLLELADGALVSIATRGYRSGPPGVWPPSRPARRWIPRGTTSGSCSSSRPRPIRIAGSTGRSAWAWARGSPLRSCTTPTR